MPVVGDMKVEVSYGEQNAKLFLYVVEGQGPRQVTMNTFEASLNVKSECKPRFHKARPVPFALKPAIEREL